MKNFLNNSKIKMIFSLCLAFLLWFYVAIILNPEIEITIRNIPVVYSDIQALTDNNLVVINDQTMMVDVKLRGERSTLKQINNENITALIDLKDYAEEGVYEIPISIKLPAEGVTLVSKSQKSIKITVDAVSTQTVDVNLVVTGTPKTGYVYTNELVSEETVTIKGPESIIRTVNSAQATLDVSGASSSISTLSDLVLLSANGVEVSSDLIEITPSKVEAMCTIGYAKTVKVTVPILNDTEKRLTASPTVYKEITLVGDKDLLDNIDSIETEPINADSIYSSCDLELKLEIPKDIITQSGMETVTVHVDVVKP